MLEIKACIACFSTGCKLYDINSGQLKNGYCWISGLKADDLAGMPHYLCVECAGYVTRFIKFRDKCKRAHFALQELMRTSKKVDLVNILEINRNTIGVAPTLSYLDLDNTHCEIIKFKWDKHSRICFDILDEIPVFKCNTVDSKNDLKTKRKSSKPELVVESIKQEIDDEDLEFNEVPLNELQTGPENDGDFAYDVGLPEDSDNDGYVSPKEENKDVDGSDFDQEYATIVPLSMKEARAALEVYKLFSNKSKHTCNVCQKSFSNEERYKAHLRMHDRILSGNFKCELCLVYYKTEFLLKSHMTEKHMYKYICKKCDEVSFDRTTAKHHYLVKHLQKGRNFGTELYTRPSWLSNHGGNRIKGYQKIVRNKRKIRKLPKDFLIYTPVSQEEQYQMVQLRKTSRNYNESNFKCELCFKGFRFAKTYETHMKKHDPIKSGKLQCDICKQHFPNTRKVYKHMIITHLFKFSCQVCGYVCFNKGQAHSHYKFHKDVTYTCPHCDKTFTKLSTKLTHIRIKHPSNYICTICGHSFVSQSGLYCHKKMAHSAEEIKASELGSEEVRVVEGEGEAGRWCAECSLHFLSEAAYATHLGSSFKHATTNLSITRVKKYVSKSNPRKRGRQPRPDIINNGVAMATQCEVCNTLLANDVQARRHYDTEHPGHDFLKRYMCDVCGHTTRQYANLMVHMRTHTNEKPYKCPHCDRRFSMPSNRDRHIVVHTGERKYQCQHCNRRFTQSSAVKLHIQTVHLKIPYAPWDKKNRKRRKELEGASTTLTTAPLLPPQPKVILDNQGDYLNAFITYNDE